jgi:hypothetical protein
VLGAGALQALLLALLLAQAAAAASVREQQQVLWASAQQVRCLRA